MNKMPSLLGFHADPSTSLTAVCALPIFVLLAVLYGMASDYRKEQNPNDKFLPSLTEMYDSTAHALTEPESRKKQTPMLINDTKASLYRISIAMLLTVVLSTFIGLNMGLYKGVDIFFNPALKIFSSVPPIALVPALLMLFGKDDQGKIMMIFFGLIFSFIMTIRQEVQSIPKNLIIKGETLGASSVGVSYRIILPQILPIIIDLIRNNIGYVWVFLIVAEQLGSQSGLGHRIFLLRRYQGWSTIYPYVMWITMFSFIFVGGLHGINKMLFPWYKGSK